MLLAGRVLRVACLLVCLLGSLTLSWRLVCLLVEFWTVLPGCVDYYQISCVVYA